MLLSSLQFLSQDYNVWRQRNCWERDRNVAKKRNCCVRERVFWEFGKVRSILAVLKIVGNILGSSWKVRGEVLVNFQYHYQNARGAYCKVASLITIHAGNTKGFMVCGIPRLIFRWTYIWSVERYGVAREWSIHRFQVIFANFVFSSSLFLYCIARLCDAIFSSVSTHRGGGYLSLENLLFFAKRYPVQTRLLFYQHVACVFSLTSNFPHKFLLGIWVLEILFSSDLFNSCYIRKEGGGPHGSTLSQLLVSTLRLC